MGTRVANLNYIHEEILSRLNMGNTYYHSVQNFYIPAYLKI